MISSKEATYCYLLQCLNTIAKSDYACYVCRIGIVTDGDLLEIASTLSCATVDCNIKLITKDTTIASLKAQLVNAERSSVILESVIRDYKSRR